MSWLDKTIERLQEDSKKKSFQDAIFLRSVRLIEEQSPYLWRELCGAIEKKCRVVNLNHEKNPIIVDRYRKNRLRLRYDSKRMKISFNPMSGVYALKWTIYSGREKRKIGRGNIGISVGQRTYNACFNDATREYAVEDVAEKIMDALLFGENK